MTRTITAFESKKYRVNIQKMIDEWQWEVEEILAKDIRKTKFIIL